MSDSKPCNPVLSRRQAFRAALYVALLAAAIWAAMEVRKALLSAGRPQAPPQLPLPAGAAETDHDWPATNPADLLSGQAPLEGMETLAGEPAGIDPPPGASRHGGFAWSSQGMRHQHARYSYQGAPQQAAEHYAALMAQAAWQRAGDTVGADGARRLTFVRNGSAVHVVLRKAARQANILEIAVTATSTGAR